MTPESLAAFWPVASALLTLGAVLWLCQWLQLASLKKGNRDE